MAGLALLGIAVRARAGFKYDYQVSVWNQSISGGVDLWIAEGVVSSTRNSNLSDTYLGCQVYGTQNSSYQTVDLARQTMARGSLHAGTAVVQVASMVSNKV